MTNLFEGGAHPIDVEERRTVRLHWRVEKDKAVFTKTEVSSSCDHWVMGRRKNGEWVSSVMAFFSCKRCVCACVRVCVCVCQVQVPSPPPVRIPAAQQYYSRRLDALRDKHCGRNLVTLSEFLCKFTLDTDAHTRPDICAPVAMVLRTDTRSASVLCAKTCVIAHLLIRFTCGRACVFAHVIDNYAHAINSLLVRPEVSEA